MNGISASSCERDRERGKPSVLLCDMIGVLVGAKRKVSEEISYKKKKGKGKSYIYEGLSSSIR